MCSSRRWLLALLPGLLGLFNCGDMLMYRAGKDYFPLVSGSCWTFEPSRVDSVGSDSTVAGRRATVVFRDFAPEFWLKTATEVRRLIRRTVIRSGREYVLEEQYGLEYALPLVVGASWAESFRDTVVLLGTDTVMVFDSVSARVVAAEDITTPAGVFFQCYRIDRWRIVQADTSFAESRTEWLAPGVGVVRVESGGNVSLLLDYHIGPRQ
ncbi:MAG: hypothetical protein ABIK86_01960 [candidate division WOR-3 bacterium]